jgi:hypothetical protein
MRKEQNKFAVVQARTKEFRQRQRQILEAFTELSLESRNTFQEAAFHLQEAMPKRRSKADFGTTAAHELLGALVIYQWEEQGNLRKERNK